MNVRAGLDLPFEDGPVGGLVRKRLPDHGLSEPVALDACWAPSYFGLDRVRSYQQASAEVRRTVLADCARATLLEAYFIEKVGVSYAAKMVLLAPTAEERSLYALFAAEEASHLDGVRAALGPSADRADWQSNPFLTWLQAIVEQADRQTSQLIIQVVLEGWGLRHYAAMRDDCRHPALRALFDRILLDEAGHHGSGVQLLRQAELEPATVQQATDLLADLLAMVKVGPAMVVEALSRGLGGLDAVQEAQVRQQLDHEAHVDERLTVLRTCLDKVPTARQVRAALTERGGFTPVAP